MSLQPIEAPTVSIKTVMTTLARHAQAQPSDDVILLNATMSPARREGTDVRSLAHHLQSHGLEADLQLHTTFMRVQGWTHFVSDGTPWWAVRQDMPTWITPYYLLPRCLTCAGKNRFECRCEDISASGKKRRREHVYILELQTPGHFYVGRTHRPERRMEEHHLGRGGSWTRLHKPLRIRALERVPRSKAQLIEEQTTRDLMAVFGASVRGGSYLTDAQVRMVLPTCGLFTRKRWRTVAPDDPTIWSR